jgi:hypothetical protein
MFLQRNLLTSIIQTSFCNFSSLALDQSHFLEQACSKSLSFSSSFSYSINEAGFKGSLCVPAFSWGGEGR